MPYCLEIPYRVSPFATVWEGDVFGTMTVAFSTTIGFVVGADFVVATGFVVGAGLEVSGLISFLMLADDVTDAVIFSETMGAGSLSGKTGGAL